MDLFKKDRIKFFFVFVIIVSASFLIVFPVLAQPWQETFCMRGGGTWDPKNPNTCTCPSGTTWTIYGRNWWNGTCATYQVACNYATTGQVWDPATKTCVCPSGTVWDSKQGKCTSSPRLNVGLGYVGGTGLGTKDIRIIIAGLMSVVTGFLGLVTIILIVYGGFLLIQAKQTNDAEIKVKAKKIFWGAAVGLIITLSSYSLSRFILEKIIGVI